MIKKLNILMFLLLISFVSNAEKQEVNSSYEFKLALKSNADTIVFASGIYKDFRFSIIRSGQENMPLVICSKENGYVVFVGNTHFEIQSSYVKFSGFKFNNGKRSKKEALIFVSGDNIEISNTKFENYSSVVGVWIQLNGRYNKVLNCTFLGKTSQASYINIDVPEVGGNYHLVKGNYFSRPPLGSNGGSAMRIGHGSMTKNYSYTIVEYNLFEECSGEGEVISSKSCANIFKYNTFLNCKGSLSLRQGKGSIVESNYFISNKEGKNKCGGVFVRGEDHIIINNYFSGLHPSKAGVISLGAASMPDSVRIQKRLIPRHFPITKKILIANNVFVNNKVSIFNFKLDYGTRNRIVLPDSSLIVNNIVISAISPLVEMDNGYSFNFETNYACSLLDFESDFFTKSDIEFNSTANLYTKIKKSCKRKYTSYKGFISSEMMDILDYTQKSRSPKDIQCFINKKGGLKNILSKKDVKYIY